jgi:hypothetical protein
MDNLDSGKEVGVTSGIVCVLVSFENIRQD